MYSAQLNYRTHTRPWDVGGIWRKSTESQEKGGNSTQTRSRSNAGRLRSEAVAPTVAPPCHPFIEGHIVFTDVFLK